MLDSLSTRRGRGTDSRRYIGIGKLSFKDWKVVFFGDPDNLV